MSEILRRTSMCGDLRISDVNKEVTLNGWVAKQRNLGSLIFIDLRDKTGICQVVFDENTKKIRFQLDLDHDGVFEYMVRKGDVNGDGIAYDVSDAQTTLQAYVNWLSSGNSRHAPCIRVNVYQADMNDAPVERPGCLETTALGAAYLAGMVWMTVKGMED